MVNEMEKQIIDIFRNRTIDKDSILGFMCVLRREKACDLMLEWLHKNQKAGYSEIYDKILEIYYRDKNK